MPTPRQHQAHLKWETSSATAAMCGDVSTMRTADEPLPGAGPSPVASRP